MSRKIVFMLFLSMTVLGLWTCDKDNNNGTPCSTAWASELANELEAMMNAAQAYGLNPTVANCNAYKEAAQDYVDALEPYGNCATLTGQDRVAWQNAVDNAQQELDNLTCSK